MKINDVIRENAGEIESVKLKDQYGGGSLSHTENKGRISSATYKDQAENIEAQIRIVDKRKLWITKKDQSGQTMNITTRDLTKMFNEYVVKDMMNHLENHINTQDPRGDRVLDLSRKINMNESKFNRDTALKDIQSEIKPFMDHLYALADRMDREDLQESTTSGCIATVASPIGGVIKRNPESFFGAPMTSEEFPNTPKEYRKKKKNAK